MPADRPRGSFGARRDADQTKQDQDGQQPVPVLHVGEVHAELRLHVTQETLDDLGSQIASMIANAAAQGFQAGMEVGMARTAGDDDVPDEFSVGGAVLPGVGVARNQTADPENVLTEEDLRRARGE